MRGDRSRRWTFRSRVRAQEGCAKRGGSGGVGVYFVAGEFELEAAAGEAEGACGACDVALMFAQGVGNHLPFEVFDRICEQGVRRKGLCGDGWLAGVGFLRRRWGGRVRDGENFTREMLGRNERAVFGAGDDAL